MRSRRCVRGKYVAYNMALTETDTPMDASLGTVNVWWTGLSPSAAHR